jgi:hypothetical protein
MSQDGVLPMENDLILGGRLYKKSHTLRTVRGGAALPKLMQNLQLFDTSVVKSNVKGGSVQKPNLPSLKKPIKFII